MLLGNNNKTGYDNRYFTEVAIGRIAEQQVDDVQTSARVMHPDKEDLISKPYPVLQPSAGRKRSFQTPRVGANALILRLPNGPSDGFILGTFYTTSDPPPVDDPNLDYTEWDDGTSYEQVNAQSGQYDGLFGGAYNLEARAALTIVAPEIILIGNVRIDGNVRINGILDVEGLIVNTHRHTGVQAGSEITGEPTN